MTETSTATLTATLTAARSILLGLAKKRLGLHSAAKRSARRNPNAEFFPSQKNSTPLLSLLLPCSSL